MGFLGEQSPVIPWVSLGAEPGDPGDPEHPWAAPRDRCPEPPAMEGECGAWGGASACDAMFCTNTEICNPCVSLGVSFYRRFVFGGIWGGLGGSEGGREPPVRGFYDRGGGVLRRRAALCGGAFRREAASR